MIDTHIHILPGIDDGSKNIQMSINMAKRAKSLGFDKIIATPHYMDEYSNPSYEEIEESIDILNKTLKAEGIDVKIFSGSEIYFIDDLLSMLENKTVRTYSMSKYFLVELPIIGRPIGYIDVMQEVIEAGYIPVVAHPERYEWIERNYKDVSVLREMGVKFQINFGSIVGVYGNGPKKNVKRLIRDNVVDLIGTDSHNEDKVYNVFLKAQKKLLRLFGREKYERLTLINPQKIIDGEEI